MNLDQYLTSYIKLTQNGNKLNAMLKITELLVKNLDLWLANISVSEKNPTIY